jgi:hypothetical protein
MRSAIRLRSYSATAPRISPDLQQQLVVRVLAHRPIEELDPAPGGRQLLEQEHLVDVVARQPVGGGDQHHVQRARRGAVAQPLQAGALEAGAAEAVIAEEVVGRHRPALLPCPRLQPFQLLRDAVGLGLALGGHAHIDPRSHRPPPLGEARPRRPAPRPGRRVPPAPGPAAARTPGPIGVARPGAAAAPGAPAIAAAS